MDSKPVTYLYDERLRDIERSEHKKKMRGADQALKEIKTKYNRAKAFYEERLRDE